jgi:MoaD family protein
MKITVKYMAQVKQAAGAASEEIDLARSSITVGELLGRLAEQHGEPLRRLLLEADGQVQPALLVFVGEEQADTQTGLKDGDVVAVLTPMAGGSS